MSLIFTGNIRKIIAKEDLTISEFADLIGEKVSRINDVLSGKQRPPFDMLEKILQKFNVETNWLITGKETAPIENISINTTILDDYSFIPMYDVEVSAGNGAAAYGVTEPARHLAFRKDWLKSRGLYAKDLNCVIARGDSMEPTISSKDTLLVDTSKTNPCDGHIYVIRSSDVLWVKRVQRQIDGNLLLISDNATYPSMPLALAEHPDIQIIGQVVQVSKDLN